METILIVIHLMLVIALVGVVLLQRSEGGGLGIGGGNAMSARQAANPLTRATAILGAAFFATSVGLGLLGRYGNDPTDVLDRLPAIGETINSETGEPVPGGGGVLDQLGGSGSGDVPSAPDGPTTGDGGVPNN